MCEKAVILQYYDDTVIGGGKEIKNNLLSMHTHTHCQQKAFGVGGEGSRIMPCQASGRILLMLL